MSSYLTSQRKLLLHFFSEHAHEAFTVSQLVEHFKSQQISQSSIYRHLAMLEQQHEIHKTSKRNTRGVYYQYINTPACQNKIHFICSQCEKTCHLSTKQSTTLQQMLIQDNEFCIDTQHTIIYGICKECRTPSI